MVRTAPVTKTRRSLDEFKVYFGAFGLIINKQTTEITSSVRIRTKVDLRKPLFRHEHACEPGHVPYPPVCWRLGRDWGRSPW